MDNLFSAGKKFFDENMQQQQQQQPQQSQHHGHYNPLPGGNKAFGGAYPPGGGMLQDDDFDSAHEEAARHAGSSGSADFFSSIVGNIKNNKGRLAEEDIDEQEAIRMHQQSYGDGHADENSIGTAAAMQALKRFTSGDSKQQSQSQFIGLALSEASKLFDDKASQGKVPSGASKESAVQQAGEFAMKMFMKSQGQQQGGLLSLASKFF